jgi:thioredoxin reductase (NADPH)
MLLSVGVVKAEKEDVLSLAVIGSGPAGLTAGMYGARAGYDTVVFQGPLPGGQLMNAAMVENWPAVKKMSGKNAIKDLKDQALSFGVRFESNTVEAVNFKTYPFVLDLKNGQRQKAYAVIVASGADPKKLGVKGEQKYWGHGVALCALCDAPFFKDKSVVVIGGGDAAVEQVMLLAPHAKHITMLVRSSEFKASHRMQQRLRHVPQLKIYKNVEVNAFNGDCSRLKSVSITDKKTGKQMTIDAEGAFVTIGQKTNIDFLNDQLAICEDGCIKTDCHTMQTSIEGVFAAGNVADCVYRQAGVACGLGTKAALQATKFLRYQGITPDIQDVIDKGDNMLYEKTGDVHMVQQQDHKTAHTIKELENHIEQGKSVALVYLFSPSCPHCIAMKPIVDKVCSSYKDQIDLIKVDVSQGQEVARHFGIQGIPAFAFYKDKERIKINAGSMTEDELTKNIDSLLD